ncbi:MAG: argininosuccinate synthase [Crenarchaeota archaeon]|nr:argininosuccinate synthase [Thermoproteota archaeon]
MSRVVLAYSGGLDTSVCIRWLIEKYNCEVITVTVDVGQEDDFREIEERAYRIGAVKHYTVDAKEEFANKYIAQAIKANAFYEGKYPLGTALARPLIAEKVVEIARKEGADAIAHGCTSKGNDQVRFEAVIRALAPDVKIIAPVRSWGMTRAEEIEYAKSRGIPVPEKHKRFSIDSNLWSRSIEGPELDDPMNPVPDDALEWVTPPEKAPDKPTIVEIEFSNGLPVAINGEKMPLINIVRALNRIAGESGVGLIDHIENRTVGFKSREVYEAPAAVTILEAHRELEKIVYTPHEWRFKNMVDQTWSDLVYSGLWLEPLRIELTELVDSMNRWISGIVRLKLYKGNIIVLGRWSEYASYDKELADYLKGWYPSDEEARGFIMMHTQHSTTAYLKRYLRR